MNHYHEPWQIVKNQEYGDLDPVDFLADAQGAPIVDVCHCHDESHTPAISHLERIVACVNACRGIPTTVLAPIMDRLFTAMMVAYAAKTDQDRLLAADDCQRAALALEQAGVNMTVLLKSCTLVKP